MGRTNLDLEKDKSERKGDKPAWSLVAVQWANGIKLGAGGGGSY